MKYRCNHRLKFGTNKCDNDNAVEETFLTDMIRQQLDVIDMDINNVDIRSIVNNIEVSPNRIEIFFKNLPIISCYCDSKLGKLHFDTLNR